MCVPKEIQMFFGEHDDVASLYDYHEFMWNKMGMRKMYTKDMPDFKGDWPEFYGMISKYAPKEGEGADLAYWKE